MSIKTRILPTIVLLLLFIVSTGCVPPVEPPPAPPPPPLGGLVVDSLGGSPVAEATVTVNSTALTTITDSSGRWGFYEAASGTFDIIVSKADMAGSKIQAVTVPESGYVKLEVIQPVYNTSNTLLTPPTITVTGITAGETYSGTVQIDVSVTPGSALTPMASTADHPSIYIKISSSTGSLWDSYSTTDTLSYNWNSALYPPGEINIKIVAYDNNNNRSEINIPVTVAPQAGNPPVDAPSSANLDYEINAITSGKSWGIYSTEPLKIRTDGTLGIKERTINPNPSIMSAQADSTIIVDFIVDRDVNTTGINVYRSSSSGGTYTLVGGTASYFLANWRGVNVYEFIDCSSELTPDSTYYYKIAYFNQYGKGPDSAAIAVRILPKYNLNLVSPANNSVTTDNTPRLTWSSSTISGATRYDDVQVVDPLTYTLEFEAVFTNGTTQVDTAALTYGKFYEWNVISQYYYFNYFGDPLCYVISLSNPNTSYISTNGAYYFTVVQL